MYELVYGYNGKVSSIQKGNMSIPICPTVLALDSEGNKYVLQAGNIDYLEFLEWNKEQKTPLDLKSTIPVIPPEKPRDIASEVTIIDERVTALEEEKETLKLQVEALEVSMIGVKEEPLEEKLP